MSDELDRFIDNITRLHTEILLRNVGTATPEQIEASRRWALEQFGITVTDKSAFVWSADALYFAEDMAAGEAPEWIRIAERKR